MKYLQYIQVKGAAGINHQLLNLQCLLREAAHLGRTAVLPPLRLTPRHNSGVAIDGQWKTYFDLCASRLADERSGEERRLPLVDRLPPRLLRTFTLPADVKRMPLRAKDFELVSRSVPAWFPRQVPRSGLDLHLHLRVRPSQRVLALALPVIDGPDSLPDGYAAVHIRRGDRNFGKLERQTSPNRIRKTLREQGVCEGSTVFFLSNEHDPAFWADAFAAASFTLRTDCMDIPALSASVCALACKVFGPPRDGVPPLRGRPGDHAPRTASQPTFSACSAPRNSPFATSSA